jgi:hypothetical protein
VGFVVEKVALGQVFLSQFHSTGAPLLGKIKKTDHLSLHLRHRVAQNAVRPGKKTVKLTIY